MGTLLASGYGSASSSLGRWGEANQNESATVLDIDGQCSSPHRSIFSLALSDGSISLPLKRLSRRDVNASELICCAAFLVNSRLAHLSQESGSTVSCGASFLSGSTVIGNGNSDWTATLQSVVLNLNPKRSRNSLIIRRFIHQDALIWRAFRGPFQRRPTIELGDCPARPSHLTLSRWSFEPGIEILIFLINEFTAEPLAPISAQFLINVDTLRKVEYRR